MSFDTMPEAKLYYNMVSPSAYQRGNQGAISYARAICKILDNKHKRLLNGTKSNELSLVKLLKSHYWHPSKLNTQRPSYSIILMH